MTYSFYFNCLMVCICVFESCKFVYYVHTVTLYMLYFISVQSQVFKYIYVEMQ